MSLFIKIKIAFVIATAATAETLDFSSLGGIAGGDASNLTLLWHNARLLNRTLNTTIQAGDTLVFPNVTFNLMGGILATGLRNVTLQFDGTLRFADGSHRKVWPKSPKGKVLSCLEFDDVEDVLITSTGTGILDGEGKKWWGAINYAIYGEDRPRLLQIRDGARLIVEHIHFINSPYWTTDFVDVDTVTIRYCAVDVRWNSDATTHGGQELEAFNTDGFDLSGSNIHIHDCDIWNQDDCVCVKDNPSRKRSNCSENWLVERVRASGLGLTIGSIGGDVPTMCVRNITFRDSVMDRTVKGVYIKARWMDPPNTAIIEDILYENITMYRPMQWAIWIGPAQQSDSAHACSLAWPEASPAAKCPIAPGCTFKNITLRNLTIIDPQESPGVIIGSESNPMQDIVFDNVEVVMSGNRSVDTLKPWGKDGYACYGVALNGAHSRGETLPSPPCFNGGKNCHPDGECQEKSAMPCCSGKSHATAECGVQKRCGSSTRS